MCSAAVSSQPVGLQTPARSHDRVIIPKLLTSTPTYSQHIRPSDLSASWTPPLGLHKAKRAFPQRCATSGSLLKMAAYPPASQQNNRHAPPYPSHAISTQQPTACSHPQNPTTSLRSFKSAETTSVYYLLCSDHFPADCLESQGCADQLGGIRQKHQAWSKGDGIYSHWG